MLKYFYKEKQVLGVTQHDHVLQYNMFQPKHILTCYPPRSFCHLYFNKEVKGNQGP